MSNIIPLSACAAALLLSSCIYWHSADRLQDPYTTYTGVDIYHPADGKIHYDPKKADKGVISEGYVIANEITFTRQSQLTNTDDLYPLDDSVEDVKPTGRQLVVKIDGSGYQKTVPALPKGLASIPAPTTNKGRYKNDGVLYEWSPEGDPNINHIDGAGKTVYSKPGWWRRRAIDCCDYVVDPLLTVVTTTVVYGVGIPVALAVTPIAAPVQYLSIQQQQQQEKAQQSDSPQVSTP